jgi:regulator of nucleoside diphosphate kinase
MSEIQIYLTRADYQRLNDVLRANLLDRSEDLGDLTRLHEEIKRAQILESAQVPKDAVTMNSRVRLRDLDSGEEMEFSLVYPSAADARSKKISVLAPVGTAVLGYRAGDTVEWDVPAGVRRLRVEEVLYQPEASGDFSL